MDIRTGGRYKIIQTLSERLVIKSSGYLPCEKEGWS